MSNPEPEIQGRRRGRAADLAAGLSLIALALLAFFPAASNGFVSWDDGRNFLTNPDFRGLAPRNLAWAWTTTLLGVYQPVAWMLFEAQYCAWGMDPRGYHLVSVLFHALNGVALYALSVAILSRVDVVVSRAGPGGIRLGAFAAAALFVTHPLRAEPASWLSAQGYLPCSLFAMLAVLAHLKARDMTGRSRIVYAILSILCFTIGTLSHATTVGVPLALLALEFGVLSCDRDRAAFFRACRSTAPLFAIALLAVVIGWAAKEPARSVLAVSESRYARVAANVAYAAWFYAYRTVWPFSLSAHYPDPGPLSLGNPLLWLPAIATFALALWLVLARPRGVVAAVAAYLAVLSPNAGLVEFGNQLVADRYSYLSSVGPMVLLAAAVACLGQRSRRAALAVTLCAVAGLIILSRAQCVTWKDSLTLWTHAVDVSGGRDTVALCNLALAQAERPGGKPTAVANLRRSVAIDPAFAKGWYNLGLLLDGQNRSDEALEAYERAIAIDPGYPQPRRNLGALLFRKQRYEEARAQLEEVVRLRGGAPGVNRDLGIVLQRLGDLQGAERAFRAEVRLSPGAAGPRLDLGMVLAAAGRRDEAERQLLEVLRIRPDMAEAREALRRLRETPGVSRGE